MGIAVYRIAVRRELFGSGPFRRTELTAPRRKGRHGSRPCNVIALRKLDAQSTKLIKHFLGFDPFGNGRDSHRLTHLVNGPDHAFVDAVLSHVADELTVDLQEGGL